MLKVIKILIVTTCITVSVSAEEKEFLAGQKGTLHDIEFVVPQGLVAFCDESTCQMQEADFDGKGWPDLTIFLVGGNNGNEESLWDFFDKTPAIIDGLAGPVESLNPYKFKRLNNGLILFLSSASVIGEDGESIIDVPVTIIYSYADAPYLYIEVKQRNPQKYQDQIKRFQDSLSVAE